MELPDHGLSWGSDHYFGIWWIFRDSGLHASTGDGLKLFNNQFGTLSMLEYLGRIRQRKLSLQLGITTSPIKEIDPANPASNRRSPGICDEERQVTNLL